MTPTKPEGVRLHTADGAEYDVDVHYVGVRDRDGVHVWQADTVLPIDEQVRVTVDVLPAKTMITFPTREGKK